MPPEDMPKWESDFWVDLMNDTGVGRPMGSTTGRAEFTGYPDEFFYDNHKDMFGDPHYGGAVKTYWTPDTLVGEIVEDEPLGISE